MQHELRDIQQTSIKRVRSELKAWGKYWIRHELGNGYPTRSACDRLSEPMIHSAPTSDYIAPPKHVDMVDRQLNQLSIDCRKAVRVQHLCGGEWQALFDSNKTFIYWLRRAELALMGE